MSRLEGRTRLTAPPWDDVEPTPFRLAMPGFAIYTGGIALTGRIEETTGMPVLQFAFVFGEGPAGLVNAPIYAAFAPSAIADFMRAVQASPVLWFDDAVGRRDGVFGLMTDMAAQVNLVHAHAIIYGPTASAGRRDAACAAISAGVLHRIETSYRPTEYDQHDGGRIILRHLDTVTLVLTPLAAPLRTRDSLDQEALYDGPSDDAGAGPRT